METKLSRDQNIFLYLIYVSEFFSVHISNSFLLNAAYVYQIGEI